MELDEVRWQTYLTSLGVPAEERMASFRRQCEKDRIPILRPETESFLRFLTGLCKPKRILEVGTAVGYSAIVMAQTVADVTIDTIEHDKERYEQAASHVEDFGLSDRITLFCADAGEKLSNLVAEKKQYDCIFMDAAKGQYITWLPMIKSLLSQGGILISDNILQEGDILESRFVVRRRDRTIHERMREYLSVLSHDPELVTSVINVGDGLALCQKKEM